MTTPAGSIRNRAMLANLKVSRWAASKKDKKISREVAAQHGANPAMATFSKALLADDALAELERIDGQARADHYRLTQPWFDGGWRILSAPLILEWRRVMGEHRDNWNAAAAAFFANYDAHVSRGLADLNGLGNLHDYPTLDEVKRKFAMTYTLLPMPEPEKANDFRVSMGDELAEALVQEAVEAEWRAMGAVVAHQAERIAAVVATMAEGLRDYKVTTVLDAKGKLKPHVENAFRDSLLGNVKDVMDMLPALNFTNDPGIAALTARMQNELLAHRPEELRANTTTRMEVADAAESILAEAQAISDRMGEFFA